MSSTNKRYFDTLNLDNKFAICLDLGGTTWKLAAISENCEILENKQIPNRRTIEDWQQLPKVIEQLLKDASLSIDVCYGIGISIAESVDPNDKKLLEPLDKHSYLKGVDFQEWADTKFGLPLTIENDARCALLGELKYGGASKIKPKPKFAIAVTLGTGIGIAALLNGELFYGANGYGGTNGGHMTIDYDGRRCHCGNIGCAELVASGWNTPSIVEEFDGFHSSALTSKKNICFEDIVEGARKADSFCITVLDHFRKAWVSVLVNLCNLFDPEVIILSGGMTYAHDLFGSKLRSELSARLWGSMPIISIAKDPSMSALLGAYSMITNNQLNSLSS